MATPDDLDTDHLEYVQFTRDVASGTLTKALSIVRSYIERNKVLLVGGMAIDFALKQQGGGIYGDNVIPDYDMQTPTHYEHGVKLAEELCRADLGAVNLVGALHTTTVKVQVNYVGVADITYVPPDVYKQIPTMRTGKLLHTHPTYQYLDMFRPRMYSVENIPFKALDGRLTKDNKRFGLLWEHYPIVPGQPDRAETYMNVTDLESRPHDSLTDYKLAGFSAYSRLVAEYNELMRDAKIDDKPVVFDMEVGKIPTGSRLMVYTAAFNELIGVLKERPDAQVKAYKPLQDRIPHHIILVGDPAVQVMSLENEAIAQRDDVNYTSAHATIYFLLLCWIFPKAMRTSVSRHTIASCIVSLLNMTAAIERHLAPAQLITTSFTVPSATYGRITHGHGLEMTRQRIVDIATGTPPVDARPPNSYLEPGNCKIEQAKIDYSDYSIFDINAAEADVEDAPAPIDHAADIIKALEETDD
jgi:hypothetical protein